MRKYNKKNTFKLNQVRNKIKIILKTNQKTSGQNNVKDLIKIKFTYLF